MFKWKKPREICLMSLFSFILHNKISLKVMIIGKEGQEERGRGCFSVAIKKNDLAWLFLIWKLL